MEIRIESLLDGARRAEGTVVVIDVFRAFTVAAIALARGAEKVLMVGTADEARRLRAEGAGDLCMGESGGRRPDGFDYGNSPFDLSRADVRGKTLIHATSAGTVGICAVQGAERIFAGALVNAAATAAAVRAENPQLVTLVAMGSVGRARADEDEQCALYLRNLLEGRNPDVIAVQQLAAAGRDARRYDAPDPPHWYTEDRELALRVDTIPLAVEVRAEGPHLVARDRRVDIG